MLRRSALLAALAVVGALVIEPATAGAATFPGWTLPAESVAPAGILALPAGDIAADTGSQCDSTVAGGQGPAGSPDSHTCLGAGLVFNGPVVGQISSIIGPTIIGPAFVGSLVQSAGNVGVGG